MDWLKCKIGISVVAIILIFIGITYFIPEEEEIPVSPTIFQYEVDDYVTTTVKLGDVVNSTTVKFEYNATSVEKLCFALSNYEIEEVYVSQGDTVSEGDVLATLYTEDLEEDLEDCETNLQKLYLELEQLQELYDFYYQKQVDYRATLTEEQLLYTQTPEEVVSNYISQMEEVEDEIWIENLIIVELEEDIEERQIIATMSGIVSFIKNYEEGEVSNSEITFIEITDSDTSMFTASTVYENMLEVGQVVEILIDDETYSATVVIPDGYEVDPDQSKFDYFLELDTAAISLTDGDTGKVDVIIEERLNVLYLPDECVSMSKGEYVVYYVGDEGYRVVKYVEIGLVAGGYTEIISGVTEGESIISG